MSVSLTAKRWNKQNKGHDNFEQIYIYHAMHIEQIYLTVILRYNSVVKVAVNYCCHQTDVFSYFSGLNIGWYAEEIFSYFTHTNAKKRN